MGTKILQWLLLLVFLLVVFNSVIYNAQQHSKEEHSSSEKEDLHKDEHANISDIEIINQRVSLATNTNGKGFGPQSPRDIDEVEGKNTIVFNPAPEYKEMNLCNIHFHKNAEHKARAFNLYAGNGDGHGFKSGYKFSGSLKSAELFPTEKEICPSKHGSLFSGDTIEVHYVHSTADVAPGATLGSCLSEANKNPQLRVETQVFVLVNDKNAMDFNVLTKHDVVNGLHQALNIPNNTGKAVQYNGSTTGPGYNEKGSPFQVSWSVRPQVLKVDIETVGQWCKGNVFKEDHAHGVRNLIVNPKLLSEIK